MDFSTNKKFFDPKHNKKVKFLMTIGTPLTILGAALLAFASIPGLRLWILMRICWFPLVIGVPLLAIAFSLRVKETDMMDLIDGQKRDFKEYCEDKLNYPGDLLANTILLAGCTAEDADDAVLPARKLKSGVLLTPTVTLSYLYIRRDRLTVFTRRISLCEEAVEDRLTELPFAEFDGAGVQTLSETPAKTYAFCLTQGGETVLSVPVFADDYTEDQFAENILHTKSRKR